MERTPIKPETVIEDLYGNEINSLMDELHKKITLREFEHDETKAYILIYIKNLNYNSIVLNEIKRIYLMNGWGNVFYNIKSNEGIISFQLYFPQIKNTI